MTLLNCKFQGCENQSRSGWCREHRHADPKRKMAVAKYRKKAVPWDEAYWNVPWVPVRWTKDQALLRTDLDPECPPKGIRTDHVKKLLAWKTRPDFDPTDKSQWWRAMVGNTSRRQAKQEAEWFRSLG